MLKSIKNFQNKFLLFSLIFIAASCNNQDEKAPIDKYKMADILLDIHFADAKSNLTVKDSLQHISKNSGKNLDSLSLYIKSIAAHYNISDIDLQKSLDWYSNNINELDSVYAILVPRIDSLKKILKPQ